MEKQHLNLFQKLHSSTIFRHSKAPCELIKNLNTFCLKAARLSHTLYRFPVFIVIYHSTNICVGADFITTILRVFPEHT